MSWLNGLSSEERLDMYEDACQAFSRGIINEREFRTHLAKLGYNASDIDDEVRQWRKD